jgi:acyl carrier protein
MNEQQILSSFTQLLRDLLGDDSIELKMSTVRSDVPAWDSFQYVSFIAAVEMELGVKFKVAEVESFATVGDIVKETQKRLSK